MSLSENNTLKSFIGKHPAFLASMLMLVMLLPLMTMRDFTPANELRYLSIADEAIADGHIFAFTNQGEPYADKPPLYFWLVMLMKLISGSHDILLLSLLSFIPAVVVICVMDKWLQYAYQRAYKCEPSFSVRFASAMMLGTSVLFMGTAIFLRMDMLMSMFIVLSLFTFYKMYIGEGNSTLDGILLPLFIFLALFTKGPVGLLLPPLSILVFLVSQGKVRDIGKYLGWKTWGIIAGLSVIWFAGVIVDGGMSYLENLLVHQTVDRAVNAFHHKEPFWYYFIVVWYIAAPYSLLLISRLVPTMKYIRSSSLRVPAGIFMAVILTAFCMLSAFSSKLAIYLLPVFPFLVYILPLTDSSGRMRWWEKASLVIPAAVFAIAGIVAIIVLAVPSIGSLTPIGNLIETYSFVRSPFTYVALAVLAFGGIVAIWFVFDGKHWTHPVISLSASMLIMVFVASTSVPRLNDFVGYGNLCTVAKSMTGGNMDNIEYVTLRVFRSENMDAYFGKDVIDFGNDYDAYLSTRIGPHILILKAVALQDHQELSAVLQNVEYCQVGEYRVYKLLDKPGTTVENK